MPRDRDANLDHAIDRRVAPRRLHVEERDRQLLPRRLRGELRHEPAHDGAEQVRDAGVDPASREATATVVSVRFHFLAPKEGAAGAGAGAGAAPLIDWSSSASQSSMSCRGS